MRLLLVCLGGLLPLAFDLDPLAGAKGVLGGVEEAEPDAALEGELAQERCRVGELGHRDREVVVGGLAIALRVGRLLLVRVQRERADDTSGQGAVEEDVAAVRYDRDGDTLHETTA